VIEVCLRVQVHHRPADRADDDDSVDRRQLVNAPRLLHQSDRRLDVHVSAVRVRGSARVRRGERVGATSPRPAGVRGHTCPSPGAAQCGVVSHVAWCHTDVLARRRGLRILHSIPRPQFAGVVPTGHPATLMDTRRHSVHPGTLIEIQRHPGTPNTPQSTPVHPATPGTPRDT